MTKKHFIALANALRALRSEAFGNVEALKTLDKVQLEIAYFCACQNPRFNRERWLAYIRGECGPNGGKR